MTKKFAGIGALLCGALVGAIVSLAPAASWAETQIVVGYGPGGPTDIVARALSELSKPYVDQPWTVINRPGGNAAIALTEVMNAKPDGQTLMVNGTSWMLDKFVPNGTRPSPDNFQFIAVLFESPYAQYVRADAPWKTLKDLVDYSKANPGKVRYGTVGSEGMSIARYDMLKDATGIEWTKVPFTGEAEVLAAILGGHIDTATGGLAPLVGQTQANQIRILGVPEDERLSVVPDVPTFKEEGYPIALHNLMVILGPKGIPADKVEQIRSVLSKVAATPDYAQFADKIGSVPAFAVGAKADALVADQIDFYKKAAPLLGK